MELKTVKEFAHKNNLGEGLKFESGLFQLDLDDKFNTITTSFDQLDEKVTLINEQLGTVYKVKGSTTVDNINSMTVGNAMIGYVYNLLDSGVITNGIKGELEVVKGGNVVYTEEGWDEFAASLDLNQCAGDNISIENNIINALGYTYNKEKESFSVGEGDATGLNSYAEGSGTTAAGLTSHAEGTLTKAYGNYSHAEGHNTEVSGDFSHAEGYDTVANNNYEHSQGVYNVSNKKSDTFGDAGNTVHSIGIGDIVARKNAQEVMQNGDHYIVGIGGYDGTNTTSEEVKTLQEVINSKVEKEEGKYLSSNDYTNSDKEKVSLIESLQTIILGLQEKVNSKEYSIDFESDSTTAQEINLMNSMSLKKLVGYNITGVNLQVGTGSAVNLVLTDNVWEGDPIVINQGERIYWDIIKYDESAPAVLGIYETKIL